MPAMTTTGRSAARFSAAILILATVSALSGARAARNLQTSFDQRHEHLLQRANGWQQQQQQQLQQQLLRASHDAWSVPNGGHHGNRRHYHQPAQNQHGGAHQRHQLDGHGWYWDVQPFLGQNGVMSDLRPVVVNAQPASSSRHPPAPAAISDKNDVISSSGADGNGLADEDEDDDEAEDEPGSTSASSAASGDSRKDGGGGGNPNTGHSELTSSPPEDPNDLESLVNEYYYVGQKYDTLKTPSQRWVQNYFKNVLPNVVQGIRSRWSDLRKRAGLESALALPVVGGVAATLAGIAGLGMYAYRRRTVVETARKRRSLDDEDEQGSFSAGESVIRLVELAKEMYDGYDVRSVDCHRRLMCQLSKTEAYRRVGADKAFKFASLVENWVDLPPPVRILVDQLKFAVSFAKSADGLPDGADGDGAAGITRQSRRVPYYVTGDAAVSENGVPSTGGGGDGGGHDSCDVAFPDCDFSFYQFVRERLFRHRK